MDDQLDAFDEVHHGGATRAPVPLAEIRADESSLRVSVAFSGVGTSAANGASRPGGDRAGNRSGQRWKALDRVAEERVEAELCRKPTWRQYLFRWLYEYNRY